MAELMQNCQETQSFKETHCPMTGNATELALLKWTNKARVKRLETIDVLPFDSKYKYMATSHEYNGKKRIFSTMIIINYFTNGKSTITLTTVQILWLNLVTSITLSYALGFEPANKNIMQRKPRDMDEKIISKYTLFRIIYVGALITGFGFLTMSLFSDESIR